ncbi:hypothetical protein [Demequina maris]|uniref:hypothetical protein n=1 Tax=Demequina maris TaxID=1638982 RepID=UPI00078271F4|nr:hypothetical protein [Demequina maris]
MNEWIPPHDRASNAEYFNAQNRRDFEARTLRARVKRVPRQRTAADRSLRSLGISAEEARDLVEFLGSPEVKEDQP